MNSKKLITIANSLNRIKRQLKLDINKTRMDKAISKEINKEQKKEKKDNRPSQDIACYDTNYLLTYLDRTDRFYAISYSNDLAIIINGDAFDSKTKTKLIKSMIKTNKMPKASKINLQLTERLVYYIKSNNLAEHMLTYNMKKDENIDPTLNELILLNNFTKK